MKIQVDSEVPWEYSQARWLSIIRKIQTSFNLLQGGALAGRMSGTAAPTAGSWAQGDIVWNSAPSAGGTVGWICTASGSPGTWKAWGSIAA